MEKTTDLVIGSSLGSELSQEEAGVLAELMSHRDVSDGEFLIDEGATDEGPKKGKALGQDKDKGKNK